MSESDQTAHEERLFAQYGRPFSSGDVIFRESEPGSEMFVIKQGRVRILKTIRNREGPLAILRAGDFFGEMAILNGHTRTATALALDDCKLLAFDHDTFEALITGEVGITVRLIRQLAHRLREADHQIENLMLRDTKSRIVNTLVKLAREVRKPDEQRLEIRITPLEFSSKVGLDVDTVKRGIFEMRDNGFLDIADGRLIVNYEELEKLYRLLGDEAQGKAGSQRAGM